MPESIDLELASTEDLVQELHRRHAALLVVAERFDEDDPKSNAVVTWYFGGLCSCLGLAYRAARSIERAMLDNDVEETDA